MIWLMVLTSTVLLSCTKDFENINTDPNNAPTALPQQLLAPALVGTLTPNMIRNRNFNNELMQVTVNMSDGEATVFRYDFRNSWSDYLYNNWYGELTNFKDIYRGATDSVNRNKSYQAISLICQSWIYSLLTDTYGDVPYFQSNQARPGIGNDGVKEPKFDAQKDIYLDIFKQLEAANDSLRSGAPAIVASSDPVFNGNISKWRKFGNSLYLRLLLRISGKAEVAPQVIAKIQEIVGNSSIYPLISNNDESAVLRWTGQGPLISPYVNGVRSQDFRGIKIGAFFIDNLVHWNDPRIDISQGAGGINRWGIAPNPSTGSFSGITSGYPPGHGEPNASYFYALDQTVGGSTPPAISMQNELLSGMILNYAEVQFMLAEIAAKGWVGNSAEDYFKNGVKASITLWLPNWPKDVTQFLNEADEPWNEAASLNEKMEKIHLFKYYALFMTDLQQWFEYRRTGHPVLPKPQDPSSIRNGGVMPARMPYPVYVQSSNPTNYKAAVAQMGGPDVMSTQVWWQKP